MPRARLSNASFIASAECPILPFLAPRVFAEFPIPQRAVQRHGRQKGIRKEEAKSGSYGLGLTVARNGPIAPRSATASAGRVAGGLLHPSQSKRHHANSSLHPDSIEHRYADISAFARRTIRGYRTLGSRRTSQSANGAPEVQEQATKASAEREPPTRKQRTLKLASRREAALMLEQERLAKLLSGESDHDVETLMKNGQYRSLSRRIGNLQRWSETQLDLSERRGNARVSFALIRAFAALDRTLYAGIGKHTRRIIIKHDVRCFRLSVQLFRGTTGQSVRQVWERWMALKATFRQGIYQRLLICLLDRKPARALQFIQVLSHDYVVRGSKMEAIADGLGHLSKLHKRGIYDVRQGWDADTSVIRQNFVATFVAIFEQSLAVQRKVCSQDLLYNIAIIASGKDLKRVWASLSEHRAYLGYDTVLHYANSFAKAGDNASALQCLEQLKTIQGASSWEATSDRQRLRWTCALILRESMSKSRDYHDTPATVATIVGLGIRMDILLYNVVMHNAMEASDYSTAFKVYNTLEENGLEADKHTYSILLHGCTAQSNPAMFSQFAQHCAEVALETRDPWLATDYLYYLYACRHRDRDKAHTVALLQQAYIRFFPSSTLEHLSGRPGAVSHVSSTGSSRNPTILTPPPGALYILLQAQIQAALATSPRQVSILYDRFRVLVREDTDPVLTKLARDPIIWNAFLLAFCRKEQFASASQLLKDMTADSPRPNIYSWNIFMQAFFKTGQVQAAERVFEIMRSRGVDPDQYTYGVLLRGYAKAQQVERIGEIMQHTDAEQEMEPNLLRALTRITNRDVLMSTLEKVRVGKEMQAQRKADEEAEEDEKRWATPRVAVVATADLETAASGRVSEGVDDIYDDQLTDTELAKLGERLDQTLDEQLSLKARYVSESSGRSSSEASPDVKSVADPSNRSAREDEHAVAGYVAVNPIIKQRPIVEEEVRTLAPRPAKQGSLDTSQTNDPVPSTRAKPENSLDPEVQYRKLQEQLGLVAGVAPSQEPATTPQPNNSFGLSLGYKSAHADQEAEVPDPPAARIRHLRGRTTGTIPRKSTSILSKTRASTSVRTVYPQKPKK